MTNPELIQAWAAVLNALAWPFAVVVLIYIVRALAAAAIDKGVTIRLKVREIGEVSIQPAEGLRPPSSVHDQDRSRLTRDVVKVPGSAQAPLPLDYYFLNHTSFLRKEKQEEFRLRTGVPLDHYDIRVILDSYYLGALERVEQVKYILHRAYPHPIQIRRNAADKFLLKELANGEYVLMAEVYLKDRQEPVLLQRYIALWESGPRLDVAPQGTGTDPIS